MKYLIGVVIFLAVALAVVVGININSLTDEPMGATVESNIVLAEGALLVGNSLGYAEEDATPTLSGDLTVTGTIVGDAMVTPIAATNQYATTTLVAADCGKYFSISASGTSIVLPAVSNTGCKLGFIIGGALDTASSSITSAAGDDIEGSIIVAGAVVDCNASDYIAISESDENIGDFVEVISTGSKWVPLSSEFLTATAGVCEG